MVASGRLKKDLDSMFYFRDAAVVNSFSFVCLTSCHSAYLLEMRPRGLILIYLPLQQKVQHVRILAYHARLDSV